MLARHILRGNGAGRLPVRRRGDSICVCRRSPRTSGCSATASTSSPTAKSGRSSARWTSTRRSPTAWSPGCSISASWAIEIPEAFGGAGASFFHAVLAVEALSRVDPSVGVLVDVQNTLVINALLRWGSEAIKQRYLPALAADTIGAYALSEAGSGSDAFAMTTRATEREDGDWSLTGRKLWITNANEAGLFIVFANGRPRTAGYRGITAFLVERGAPGFTVGQKEDKLGIRASSTCELILEDCRVPRRTGPRRGRQGLQGRDRDAQRGADRHRRADDRAGAGRARSRDRLHAKSGSSSARRLPNSRRCSTRSRARRPSSRRRG